MIPLKDALRVWVSLKRVAATSAMECTDRMPSANAGESLSSLIGFLEERRMHQQNKQEQEREQEQEQEQAQERVESVNINEEQRRLDLAARVRASAAQRKLLSERRTEQRLSSNARERHVASTQLGRLVGFGSVAASVGFSVLGDAVRNSLMPGSQVRVAPATSSSTIFSEASAERLAAGLCRMRGAALKLGQMLSIQGGELLPKVLADALERVRQGADMMPARQLRKVMRAELGDDWRSLFVDGSFDERPIAAASIGQVHRAAVSSDGGEREVAVKIQYPGVADSIDSDLNNLAALLNVTGVVPKGMHLDNAIRVARRELKQETDYRIEAANQRRFRELLADDPSFYVPEVFGALTTRRVLVTEMVYGCSVERAAESLGQEQRDWLGAKIMELALRELFEFRFMQTDPNWANFFYDAETESINLIDFGACRPFDESFSAEYLRTVRAAAELDRDTVLDASINMGFLTGDETEAMRRAHVDAVLILGEPFARRELYDFVGQDLTSRIHTLIPTMLRDRLTAPPDASYSLHRKLSGAFILCTKLRARIDCRSIFNQVAK
jgi:aarF domain-containing kinase